MRIGLLYKMSFLILIICGVHNGLFAQDNTIKGRIFSFLTGKPIANAIITNEDHKTLSDSLGNFQIELSPENDFIDCFLEGFIPASIQAPNNRSLGVNIYLLPDSATTAAYNATKDSLAALHSGPTDSFLTTIGIYKGKILDADNEGIIGAAIRFRGANDGTTSDENGLFTLYKGAHQDTLEVNMMGYESFVKVIKSDPKDSLIISLKETKNVLKTVVIAGRRKGKYSNKNNPAVTLIRNVIDQKDINKVQHIDSLKYESYDKISLYATNVPNVLKRNPLLKKFSFIFNNLDPDKVPDKELLPIYIQEQFANNFVDKSDHTIKKDITSDKKMLLNPKYIQNGMIETFLSRLYSKVDIYENNIFILTNTFLSPIAQGAPSFYKYYLVDTQYVDKDTVIYLDFSPRSPKDFAFQGRMGINISKNFAVTDVVMEIPKEINLNWARKLEIELTYQTFENKIVPKSSTTFIDFGLLKMDRGLFGERVFVFDKFEKTAEKATLNIVDIDEANPQLKKNDTFWQAHRPIELSKYESQAYKNIDSLNSMPAFNNLLKFASVLSTGYYPFKKLEIGSYNSLVGYNPVEGFRVRLGLRTNIKETKRYNIQTYLAYGFNDQQFKYFIGGTYSLNNKYIFSYPAHYLQGFIQRETVIPGTEMGFAIQENIFSSFKRGDNTRWVYNDYLTLNYFKEFPSRFSTKVGFNYLKQTLAGSLSEHLDPTIAQNNLKSFEINAGLRWAPKEEYFQQRFSRTALRNKYPIFSLDFTFGIPDVAGSQFNYQKVDLNIYKRFYFSQLGYANVTVAGIYLKGKVPSTLLIIPQTNQSYYYASSSFNLMNSLEFASDKQALLDVEYHMMGFLLNKVPLVKYLKLREVFTFKAIMGSVSDANNYKLYTPNADPLIYNEFNGTPYMEAGFGVENILKLVRIDFLKRLTYTDLPMAPKYGIRFSLAFDY